MSGRVGSITTDIIADGLVFNVDAANRACYPKTGTTATDTINNTTGTLQSLGMFENVNNGVFDFDGATNYISFNSINLGTTYTIQFWVKRGDTGNTGVIIGNSTGTQKNTVLFNGINYIYFRLQGDNTYLALTPYLGGSSYASLPFRNTTDWGMYTVTRNGDNVGFYINTQNIGVGTAPSAGAGDTNTGWMGASNANAIRLLASIGPTHYYNRVLSANEVQHNYNALKGRFGL